MRKLILETQVSIDGFMAGADGNTDWMTWNWGPEWTWDAALQRYHTGLTLSADTILLSKQMAEGGFIRHWQETARDKSGAQYEFARHITLTPKIVFSTTIEKSKEIPGGWDHVSIARDAVGEIKRLKNLEGKNLIVYGGATLVSSLIKEKLVDEFHLFINPVAIGSGMPLFTGTQALTLENARKFDCGVSVLHYKL